MDTVAEKVVQAIDMGVVLHRVHTSERIETVVQDLLAVDSCQGNSVRISNMCFHVLGLSVEMLAKQGKTGAEIGQHMCIPPATASRYKAIASIYSQFPSLLDTTLSSSYLYKNYKTLIELTEENDEISSMLKTPSKDFNIELTVSLSAANALNVPKVPQVSVDDSFVHFAENADSSLLPMFEEHFKGRVDEHGFDIKA